MSTRRSSRSFLHYISMIHSVYDDGEYSLLLNGSLFLVLSHVHSLLSAVQSEPHCSEVDGVGITELVFATLLADPQIGSLLELFVLELHGFEHAGDVCWLFFFFLRWTADSGTFGCWSGCGCLFIDGGRPLAKDDVLREVSNAECTVTTKCLRLRDWTTCSWY